MKLINISYKQLSSICLAFLFSISILYSQETIDLKGIVSDKNSAKPLIGVTIILPQYGIWTITDIDGVFILKNVPKGKTKLIAEMLGMIKEERVVDVKKSDNVIRIQMQEVHFGLNEVVVTAKRTTTGASTASSISRSAIEHLQATSLTGIMELLPGNAAVNPNLSSPGKISIRQIQSDPLNSMGTSLIVNGSPVSNNANLQIGNTASSGSLNTDFTSTAGSGVDLRQISIDNVESVDVIRGIPSVEYGDLTSGVVIVNPKAGVYPIQLRAKLNPTLTQVSLGKGFKLGKEGGNLSIDADYAKSLQDERRPYQGYQRITANALYSKTFKHDVRATIGLGFISDLDAQKLDPSDLRYKRVRSSENQSYKFNTNIVWNAQKSFLKSIRFNFSADYSHQKGYFQELRGNFGYMITTAMVDGTITSNQNQPIFDVHGNQITNQQQFDPNATTIFLPYEFLTKKTIDGKPLNIFAKITSSSYAKTGAFEHKIIFGTDWKTDINFGKGVVFDPLFPPSAGVRMRPYTDIPALNQFGLFLEENLKVTFLKREFNLQAGLRMDLIQPGLKEQNIGLSPRFNASYDLIPDILTLRGGWGITSKAPPLMYLYPDNAYYDFVNFDNIATTTADDPSRLSVITTKVYSTKNDKLKMARNNKAELGLDFTIKQFDFSFTAYSEKLTNGFSFGLDINSFQLFEYIKYIDSNRPGTVPVLTKESVSNIVLSYQRPLNNKVNENRGLEFDMDFGQIKAIRTSFVFNGAYMQSRSYSDDVSYYQKSPDPLTGKYKDIGVYASGDGSQYDRILTNLRIIHNIPKVKLLFSLSIQTIWMDRHKYLGIDNIHPIGYLSAKDFSYNDIAPGSEIPTDIQKPILESRKVVESYSPLFLFNLRMTKEIKDYGGFAFFINNLFMSQPYEESKRTPGFYVKRNPDQFFGVELWLKF